MRKFSPTGDHRPFKPEAARRALHELLSFAVSEEYAAEHFWHDFRATICSALIGAKQSPETAQAMVCWASPQSVALYGQMSADAMADAAELAARTGGI